MGSTTKTQGKQWERVQGTAARTHPSPLLASYIDAMTERVNRLVTLKGADGELVYKTRRAARRAARRGL